MAVGGAKWQSAHSCGTAGVAVRTPLLQSTASCFISPLAGERLASIGPTNPTGTEVAWQSRQACGCVASEACSRPWRKSPVAAPAWQASHVRDCGTVALLCAIGIGSVSLCATTDAIEELEYVGTSATTTMFCAGCLTPSGAPTPHAQSPPGSVRDALKYLTYAFAATRAWGHEKQSAVPFTAWSKLSWLAAGA